MNAYPAIALLLLAPAVALADEPVDTPEGLVEKVEVSAKRLPVDPEPESAVPAHVTVLDREAIARSGARTLQELLALQAGVLVYDQNGNGIQQTLDLRGFSGGTGTKVYLDGAPLNDPRNNALALELVPLASLERIEIVRGSTAALAGGGAQAGVIHLLTRHPERLGGRLAAAVGTDDARRYDVELGNRWGRWDVFLTGGRDATDGFRENAGGDLRRVAGTAGLDLGDGRRLELALLDARSAFGTPGALTGDELAADPTPAPFNRLDFVNDHLGQATVNYRGPLSGGLSFAVNAFARDRDSHSLATGRSAVEGGGSFLDSRGPSYGSTVQLGHTLRRGGQENGLTLGLEWLDGTTDARQFSTPPEDLGQPGPTPASDTTTERTTLALYVQDSWRPVAGWTFLAGARLDRDRLHYRQTLPIPTNDRRRRFSEVSLRAGATYAPAARWRAWIGYGEGFLAPTVEELFAFPLFFSNPDLEPEDSRSLELGTGLRWGPGSSLTLAAFTVDTEDEIVFDPDSDVIIGGANVNAGRTRRQGLEATWAARPRERLELFASATWTDATFRNGEDEGRTLPLVPRGRAAAGLRVGLPRELALRAQALWVGRQVLDSDGANAAERLRAYTVVDARLSWSRPAGPAGPRRGPGATTLFVEGTNLFDREYQTRGILAFDFGTSQDVAYFTPAPGRRFSLGAEWSF